MTSSLGSDDTLLIAEVCHLLRRSTGQLRIVRLLRSHRIQVFVSLGVAVCQQSCVQPIHIPCSHPLPPASRCEEVMDAHRYLHCHAACGMLSVPGARTLGVTLKTDWNICCVASNLQRLPVPLSLSFETHLCLFLCPSVEEVFEIESDLVL